MHKFYTPIKQKNNNTEIVFVQYSKYNLTAKALEFLYRTQNTYAFVDFTVNSVKIYGNEDDVFIYVDEIRENLGGATPRKILLGKEAMKEVL